ncbi:integrase [Peribacillus asahii]|uniref:Integrase n=1 Tax=Peribacillus asahii TaxID=228899 RepID=A0A3T0KX07_9BACI|nr:integrase [Peribacillus asahii]
MRGSVKKDNSGWYYVVDVGTNGKRKQQKRRFKTKKEAEKALAEVNYALNKGTYFEPSNMLYKDYLEQWFSTKRNSIGIQTAKVYKDFLHSKIIPELGNCNISKLSIIQLQSFIDKLSEKGLSSVTVKQTYEIIRNSLEHAVDFELISKNPAIKVKLPKANKKEMTVWNEEEVNRFLKVAKEDPLYIVFHLALMTGMRQGEILGLRWKDVDLKKAC